MQLLQTSPLGVCAGPRSCGRRVTRPAVVFASQDASTLHRATDDAVRGLLSLHARGGLDDEISDAVDLVAAKAQADGLATVNLSYNTGFFKGNAIGGRLKRVLDAQLTLPDLSWNLFDEPSGSLKLLPEGSGIVKGAVPGYSEDPSFYAVVSRFEVEGGDVGTSTAVGSFEVKNHDTMVVTFTGVRLEYGGGVVERSLRKPAEATLTVLAMSPDLHVTQSNFGSIAVLERKPS